MQSNEIIKLCSINNSLEAERIILILKDNEIESFSKNGIMKVYGGNSIANDIYVSSDDYQKALDVISQYNLAENNIYERSSNNVPSSLMPRTLGVILLIIMAAIILTPIIFLLITN